MGSGVVVTAEFLGVRELVETVRRRSGPLGQDADIAQAAGREDFSGPTISQIPAARSFQGRDICKLRQRR